MGISIGSNARLSWARDATPLPMRWDRRGADLVATLRDVDRAAVGWKPKDNRMGPIFLDHLININNVRVVTQILLGEQCLFQDRVDRRTHPEISRVSGQDADVRRFGQFYPHLPGRVLRNLDSRATSAGIILPGSRPGHHAELTLGQQDRGISHLSATPACPIATSPPNAFGCWRS